MPKKKPRKAQTKKTTKKAKKPSKHWGFEVGALPKYVRQYVDQDYIQALKEKDPKALEWLNDFNEEYYGNTFRKDIVKKLKKGKKKRTRKGLHQKAGIERKELYRQTNERYRDIYNQRLMADIAEMADIEYENPEDAIIERLDLQREGYDFGQDDEF